MKNKPKEKSIISFNPTIMLDGKTYTPKGYEWILGFAFAGCKWAIDKASTEEFRLMIKEDLKKESDKKVLALIKDYELRIAELKEDLYNEIKA